MNIQKIRKANARLAYEKDTNDSMVKAHPRGGELAILRKEIMHIEEALNIQPTEEFSAYCTEAENKKRQLKKELELE